MTDNEHAKRAAQYRALSHRLFRSAINLNIARNELRSIASELAGTSLDGWNIDDLFDYVNLAADALWAIYTQQPAKEIPNRKL